MRKPFAAGGVGFAFVLSLVLLSGHEGAAQTARKTTTTINIPAGAKVTVQGATARISGQGISGTYSCKCNDTGACQVEQDPHILTCAPAKTNGCKGSCEMATTSLGGAAARGSAVRAPATTIAPAVK